MSNTSIGPDDDKGGNENHDGRPHRTMGEASYPNEPPAGAEPLAPEASDQSEAARGKPSGPGA